MKEPKLPLISVLRHRLFVDGEGVTTLIAAKGCPLDCRMCINREVLSDKVPFREVTPEELLRMVEVDDLYFQATGGGPVFGGGESLLHADFLVAWDALAPREWKTTAETSLNVPSELFRRALPAVDFFIIDIKEMNPDIYRAYTGRDNAQVAANLRILAEAGRCADTLIRVPLIPGFNTEEDCRRSVEVVKAIGPFEDFDLFTYIER